MGSRLLLDIRLIREELLDLCTTVLKESMQKTLSYQLVPGSYGWCGTGRCKKGLAPPLSEVVGKILNQLLIPNVIMRWIRKDYPFKVLPITTVTKIFTSFDITWFIKIVVPLLARQFIQFAVSSIKLPGPFKFYFHYCLVLCRRK